MTISDLPGAMDYAYSHEYITPQHTPGPYFCIIPRQDWEELRQVLCEGLGTDRAHLHHLIPPSDSAMGIGLKIYMPVLLFLYRLWIPDDIVINGKEHEQETG